LQDAKRFTLSWQQLKNLCADPDSQARLTRLYHQFGKPDRGVSESALAEIDTALWLVRAGLSPSFVKEMGHRTADLECYLEEDRLFVEVTVIVPTDSGRTTEARPVHVFGSSEEEGAPDFLKNVLVKRILARIAEKDRQLVDYCAPILLAIIIACEPNERSLDGQRQGRRLALDLQQLGGVITAGLNHATHLSGVLLTLKNIQPAVSRANIRLSNVSLGEWVSETEGASRVRVLVLNPFASYVVELKLRRVLQQVL